MESKEKEGKLNEAEKVEQKLKLGSKQKAKTGSTESETLCYMTHTALVFCCGSYKVATVGMNGVNGVKKIIPVQAHTLRATQETKTLPGDQSWCPTCSFTFSVSTALYSFRLTGSSGDASLAIRVYQFSK